MSNPGDSTRGMGGVRHIMGLVQPEHLESSPFPSKQTSIQRLITPSGPAWSPENNALPLSRAQAARISDKELEGAKRNSQPSLRSRLRSRWCVATLIVAMLLIIALIISLVLTVGKKGNGGGAQPLASSRKDTIVTLADGQYQGVSQSDGVTSWLGMRYAAPPVGNLRFAAPQDPPKFSGVTLANQVSCPRDRGVESTCTDKLHSMALDVQASAPRHQAPRIAFLSMCTRQLTQHLIRNFPCTCTFKEAGSRVIPRTKMGLA